MLLPLRLVATLCLKFLKKYVFLLHVSACRSFKTSLCALKRGKIFIISKHAIENPVTSMLFLVASLDVTLFDYILHGNTPQFKLLHYPHLHPYHTTSYLAPSASFNTFLISYITLFLLTHLHRETSNQNEILTQKIFY
jgi:hypothetical protein